MTRALPPLTLGAVLRWDIVNRLLPTNLGDVLEIGCGQGGFAVRIAARSRSFLGVEPDPQSFAMAEQRLPGAILNIDVNDLPPDHTFDTICAFEVIEHLAEDKFALASWVARLRPGGTLLVSTPAHASRLGASDALVGHYRRYDPDDIANLLADAGLIDVTVRLYGWPLGWILEEARNALARRKFAKSEVSASLLERTAGSGRFLQPGSGSAWRALQIAMRPFLFVQSRFPKRGVALVASGRRPVVPA